MSESNVELVRAGFEAAARGDLTAIEALLDENVYWGNPEGGGCRNREQALEWMSVPIANGVQVCVLDARELEDGRILVVLQRNVPREGETEPPPPHAQLVRFRDGKAVEMLVYPDVDEAVAAAAAT